jgi:hypothetical protein
VNPIRRLHAIAQQALAVPRQIPQRAGPAGGMKLARIRPCARSSANHSQSRTSVFRPGTALMCRALASTTVTLPSSRLNTGCQYTPSTQWRHAGTRARSATSLSGESPRSSSECLDLLLDTPALVQAQTYHKRLFVDIDAPAAVMQYLHRAPLGRDAPRSTTIWKFTWRAPTPATRVRQQCGVPRGRHSGPFFSGLGGTSKRRPSPGRLAPASATTFMPSVGVSTRHGKFLGCRALR